jgi:ABC-2 type transport system permease protein
MRGLRDALLLTRRALREAIRQPANELPNAFIPLFFYVVTVGAIGDVARDAFGVTDYKGFQLPVALLQGAAGTASGAGLALTLEAPAAVAAQLAVLAGWRG